MKTVASEVRPATTPSIGTGNASAAEAAARSASEPATSSSPGSSTATATSAATAATSPAQTTGASTGRTWRVSGASRLRERSTAAAGAASTM